MFDGLLRGVPTVILPERIKDPLELMNFIQTHRITKLTCVPALATEMLESGAEARAKLATLDCLHLSGELLKGELVETDPATPAERQSHQFVWFDRGLRGRHGVQSRGGCIAADSGRSTDTRCAGDGGA